MNQIDILLVEDNPGDARLAQEALAESKIKNSIHWVRDGESALRFLEKQGEYSKVLLPDLILLDLNLPGMTGHDILGHIKSLDEFRKIPVIVLTSSDSESDIQKSYDLHANCYVKKPIGFDQFLKVVQSIDEFWLSIVELPKGGKK